MRTREMLLRAVCLFLTPLVWWLFFSSFALSVSAEDEEQAAEVIREGFYSFSDSIDVSQFDLTTDRLSELFTYIIKDDPYLFYVDGRLAFSYCKEGYVQALKPCYTMLPAEVEAAWFYLRQQLRKIAETAVGTDAEKALLLHDHICLRFSYDDSLKSDDMYDLFTTGRGTCQAYAMVYLALLREVGITAHFVASDSIAHIWNLVRLDGEWYHVDLTWDDGGEEISYRHFLLSDTAARERGHKDWYSPVSTSCNSEKYRDCDFNTLLCRNREKGDADHNGSITVEDLAILRALSLETYDSLPYCRRCADMDGDGQIKEEDAGILRRKILQEN